MKTDKKKDERFSWIMSGKPSELNAEQRKGPVPDAYDAWSKEKTPGNTSMMLKTLKPTIESALTSYAGTEKDSLRTKATLMALHAVDTYDPAKRAQLKSHVFNHLKGLNREKARRFNAVHIPENVLLERNRINKEYKAFQAEHDREPTMDELSDATGLSHKRIEYAENNNTQRSSSQLLSEKGDSLFKRTGDSQKIWSDYVYHDLDGPDKKIFEWSTGYGGVVKISKGDIARRLRISPAAVSRRITKIIHMLEGGLHV